MTTLTNFLAMMQGVSIAGVTALASVPSNLNESQIPVSFPMFPEASFEVKWSDENSLNSFNGDLIVLFAKANQGTPEGDYTTLVELVDATHTAILAAAGSFPTGQISWNIGTRINYNVGTSGDFHAIVATITAEI